jgi:hypothetical protein
MRALAPACTLLAALAVLCSPGRVQAAAPADPCQSFTRASAEAPEIVRHWLTHSNDDHVLVCTHRGGETGAEPAYFAESRVVHEGGVCSYSSHVLVALGSGAKRALHLYEHGDSVYMALAAAPPCPAAHPAGSYTETYDVSPAAFESLMRHWTGQAAATRAGALLCPHCSGPSAHRLHAAIEAGRMKGAPVIRIVRIPGGGGFTRRYELFVADPQRAAGESTLYVVYFTRWLAGPWHVSGIADTAD